MNKRMMITMIAIMVGVIASCIGTLVERIDYVVSDGRLHIETKSVLGDEEVVMELPDKRHNKCAPCEQIIW
jgi:hypothetical protein